MNYLPTAPSFLVTSSVSFTLFNKCESRNVKYFPRYTLKISQKQREKGKGSCASKTWSEPKERFIVTAYKKKAHYTLYHRRYDMLLFNLLKDSAGRRNHGGTRRPPREPSVGAYNRNARDDYVFLTTSLRQRIRLTRFSYDFSLRGLQERSLRSSMSRSDSSVESSSSPSTKLGKPFRSFSAVINGGTDGAVRRDGIPDIIASKIHDRDELWHRVAVGQPSDKRAGVGLSLHPAIDTTSSPSMCTTQDGERKRASPIDYSNAKELTLSTTHYNEKDTLCKENALPKGAPRFMIHPYAKRKVEQLFNVPDNHYILHYLSIGVDGRTKFLGFESHTPRLPEGVELHLQGLILPPR